MAYSNKIRNAVIAAYYANELNADSTGKQFGIASTTVRRWIAEHEAAKDPERHEEAKEAIKDLAGMFEDLARRMVEDLLKADPKLINPMNKAKIAGIAVDKNLALRQTEMESRLAQIEAGLENLQGFMVRASRGEA